MKDLLLIGGPGVGKTTLAEVIKKEIPDINYVYLSKYNVRIPLTLIATTHPNLMSLPKEEYVEKIYENEDIQLNKFTREELDNHIRNVIETYGRDIIGELAFRSAKDHDQTLIDSITGVENVKFLKDRNFYVLGLYCDFNTQLKRRLEHRKEIDPSDPSELEKQVKSTNELYGVPEILDLAHVNYDTDKIRSSEITKEVIKAIR